MDKQTIALLGGRGMLGTALTAAFRRRGFEVHIHDLPEFDLGSIEHLSRAANAADVVVNCAAFTDVDGAESKSQIARRVNAEAVGLLRPDRPRERQVGAAFQHGFRVRRPARSALRRDRRAESLLSEYGRTKLAGERLLQDSGCDCCIMRLQWTYGPNGNHFISKLRRRAPGRRAGLRGR
jgi:dTDP-4-dehydrorhamnose reductase